MASTGIGDSTTAGLVTAAGTIGGIIAGVVLARLVKYIQRVSLGFGLGMMGIAMVVLGAANNLPLIIVAALFIGFALSIGFAQCPFVISVGTSPNLVPLAMGVFSAASSLGGFLSPVVMNALSGAFTGGSASGCCIIAGIIAIIACVAFVASGVQGRILDRAFAPADNKVGE